MPASLFVGLQQQRMLIGCIALLAHADASLS